MYTQSKDRTGRERISIENPSLLWKKGQSIAGIIPSELVMEKDGTVTVASYALVSRPSALKAAESWLRMRGYDPDGTLVLSSYALSLPRLLKPLLPFFRANKADGYIAVIDMRTKEPRKVSVSGLLSSPNLLLAIDWARTAKRGLYPEVHIYGEENERERKSSEYSFLLPPSFTIAAKGSESVVRELSEFVRTVYGSCYERFMDSVVRQSERRREQDSFPLIPLREKERGSR